MRFLIAAVCALSACSGVIVDPSPSAIASGDMTLISTCEVRVANGVVGCRVKEGDVIQGSWNLIIPASKGQFLDGEVVVKFRNFTKPYPIVGALVQVPFVDIYGSKQWEDSDSGLILATAKVRYKDAQGVEKIWQARGVALTLVLKPGYDTMPFGSGFAGWAANCDVEYSSAGRSAVKCK